MRDNMYSWILEQRIESVPWCCEIQNQNLRISLIFIPILHGTQEVWSLNQFTCMCQRDSKRIAYTHKHTISMIYIYKIQCFYLLIHNWLPNWASILGQPNWALVCGLRWDQREQIRLALIGLRLICQLLIGPKLPLIIFNTTI